MIVDWARFEQRVNKKAKLARVAPITRGTV
jgi:fluoroacetyl-CoA thioesterase